jgi:uncharacterized protein involved in exopolysaccharide biosynthesis
MAVLQTLPEATTVLPVSAGGRASLAARSVLYAVFKHRRLVLGVFLVVFLASTVAAVLRPPGWRASTKVLVKLGETVQLAPAEAPSRSVYLPLSQEVVKTEAEIVKSREVVREAIHRVGVKPGPGTDLDELIESMRRALTVMPLPGSNVLTISFLGRSRERVADMVNAITDVYIEHHNRVYRNEGIHAFYGKQLRFLATELKRSQRHLRQFLRKTDIVDVEREIYVLTKDVIDRERGLGHHRVKTASTSRNLVAIRDQLARTPVDVAYTREYQVNPTLKALQERLTQLEVERMELLRTYLPSARPVRDKEAEIARVRAHMEGEVAQVVGAETFRRNENYAELERRALTLEVHVSDLEAREPELAARLAAEKARLRRLRDLQFVVGNLEQDVNEKKYALDLYRKKREEARITEAMENQAMVNVSVMERAAAPLEPVNSLLLPLLVGIVGGLGLAAAMAVAVEYVNRRLRFEEEVERYLELPVLAVIPELETTSAIARA